MSQINADTNDPEISNSEKVVGAIVLLLVVLVAAWAISSGVVWLFSPSLPEIDVDTQAYVMLDQAVQNGNWFTISQTAREAYSSATDPELRTLADLLQRLAEVHIKSDVETIDEANSWSGWLKSFVTGWTSPLTGLEGIGVTIDVYLGDVEEMGNTLDSRYLPRIENYAKAEQRRSSVRKWSWWLFWILGVAGTVLVIASMSDEDLNAKNTEGREEQDEAKL